MSEKKGFFRKLLDQYNDLCKDLGVENGACRSCVPVVKFDPEREKSDRVGPTQEKKSDA